MPAIYLLIPSGNGQDLIPRPETLTAGTAVMRMSYLVVASGGTHRVQAPVHRGGRLSIFPEIRAADESAK